MPQLGKGGKWIFGWVVVRAGERIIVPPKAYRKYGFQAGDKIAFTRSSRSSGGFGIGRADQIPEEDFLWLRSSLPCVRAVLPGSAKTGEEGPVTIFLHLKSFPVFVL
jgi:hypothetical protein